MNEGPPRTRILRCNVPGCRSATTVNAAKIMVVPDGWLRVRVEHNGIAGHNEQSCYICEHCAPQFFRLIPRLTGR